MNKTLSVVTCTAAFSALSACGGSSSSGTNPIFPGDGTLYEACTSTYYQNIIGQYEGVVEFVERDGDEIIANCSFDLSLSMSGTSALSAVPGVAGCILGGSFTSTASQNLFLPDEDSRATQCNSSSGSLFIANDPHSSVVNPREFYENVEYPVELTTRGPVGQVVAGPYQDNPDVVVSYHLLYGGGQSLATGLMFDESSLSITQVEPEPNSGQTLTSAMEKTEGQ